MKNNFKYTKNTVPLKYSVSLKHYDSVFIDITIDIERHPETLRWQEEKTYLWKYKY